MPVSVTPADIRAVNGSAAEDAVIQPFADAAICIMGNIEICLTSKSVTDSCADIAGAWLGAHLMAMSNVGSDTVNKKSEKFENYSVEKLIGVYSGRGVLQTTYGQTANQLTAGCLQQQDKAPAGICFFG